MIYILNKFYTRNLHLLHRILFVVLLKFVISVEPFLETILLKLMDLFFFWMSLRILCKGHCVTKSEVIFHFLWHIHGKKTLSLFDVVEHMLPLF